MSGHMDRKMKGGTDGQKDEWLEAQTNGVKWHQGTGLNETLECWS